MSLTLDTIPVLYINLDLRTDRMLEVEKELKKLGFKNVERFKAIKLENGALGCSMSHLKCLELAKARNYEYVFVCEDDIEFLDPSLLLSQFKKFVDTVENWDVVLVAGNNMIPYAHVNDSCIRIFNCQTTTGYIVKRGYYDTLITNYKTGIQKLMKEPGCSDYRIDKFWFQLQRNNNWYLIIPPSVVQRESYSDIEKKTTNFSKYMLNYNKAYK